MELRIAHGMQLLYGQGAAFIYLFYYSLCAFWSATHTVFPARPVT